MQKPKSHKPPKPRFSKNLAMQALTWALHSIIYTCFIGIAFYFSLSFSLAENLTSEQKADLLALALTISLLFLYPLTIYFIYRKTYQPPKPI